MATNGFFGNVKEFFGGKPNEQKSEAVPYQRPTTRHDAPTAHGRKHATGAFGGTGTGRGRRGMPGRKLAKKTIIVSFSAGFPAGHIGANSAIKHERDGRIRAEEQRDGAQKRVSELLDKLYTGEKDERKQHK